MNLDFHPAHKHPELLAPSVYRFIQDFDKEQVIKAAQINPDFADGDLLSQHYGILYEMEVNCLVVQGQRGDKIRFAALLVPYGKKAKTNATVKGPLDAAKVSFAKLDDVLTATGMEFGSITPIGLPEDWAILIDASLLNKPQLVLGGGLVSSKILVPSSLLPQLPNAQVIEDLAK